MSEVRKNFFLYDVTIAACLKNLSHFNRYFRQKRKKPDIVSPLFYLKGGNLKAASLACISNFVDKNV